MTKADFLAFAAGSSAATSTGNTPTAQRGSSRRVSSRQPGSNSNRGKAGNKASNGVPDSAVVMSSMQATAGGEGGSASSTQASSSAAAAAAAESVGSNPRNTAAGTLRSQSPTQSAATSLSFMAYQLLRPPYHNHDDNPASSSSSTPSGSSSSSSSSIDGADGASQQQPLYVLRSQYDSLQWLRAAGFDVSKDVCRCGRAFQECICVLAWW